MSVAVVIAAEVLRMKLQQERACWVVAGTRCGGKVQGEHAQKIANCMKCDFYLLVAQEEGAGGLINGLRLLEILRTSGTSSQATSAG